MFSTMKEILRIHSNKLAFIYHDCNSAIKYTRTFREIYNDYKLIKENLSNVPKNTCVALSFSHVPCMIPLIYCLLDLNLTFMFVDESTVHKHSSQVEFYAFIKCKNHQCTDQIYTELPDKIFKLTTGCEITLKKIKEKNKCKPYDCCYIIQTSGTMGKPKYVHVTHKCIQKNIEDFIAHFGITPNDIIYFGTPLTFDPSIVELFLGLMTGSCLLSTCKSIRADPEKLYQILFNGENPVTWMQMCPSGFLRWDFKSISRILNESALKILGLGGEPFPNLLLPLISKNSCKIYNFYGITEISCWASMSFVSYQNKLFDKPISSVSLGHPLSEIIFQLRDGNDETISLELDENEEVEGILYIGSSERICLIDEEIIDDFKNNSVVFRSTGDLVKYKNGEFFYCSRADDIVKRFGKRFCLKLCEENITKIINLPVACIYCHEKLFAFILVEHFTIDAKDKIIDKIRVKLVNELERLNVPDHLELLHNLPIKSHNGKLDKNYLSEKAQQIFKDKSNENLVENYCQILGISEEFARRNPNKNFWDFGGDSIKAIQFLSNIKVKNKNRDILNLPFKNLVLIESMETYNSEENIDEILWKIEWKTDLSACIDSPAMLIRKENGAFVVAVGNFAHNFALLDASNGKVIRKVILPNVIESGCLVSPNGKFIYLPCFDGYLYCLTYEDLEIVWKFKTGDRMQCVPVWTAPNCLIFASYDKFVYKVNEDGNLIWKTNISEPVKSSMTLLDKKIFLSTIKGNIFCLNSANGSILWSYKTKHPIFHPGITPNQKLVLFVDIKSNIYAFSTEGFIYQSNSEETATFSSAITVRNLLLLPTETSEIKIFTFSNEEITLIRNIFIGKGPIFCLIRFNNKSEIVNDFYNELLIVLTNGLVLSMKCTIDKDNNLQQEHITTAYRLPNQCFSSPVICKNRIFLGCRDNNFYCLNMQRKT